MLRIILTHGIVGANILLIAIAIAYFAGKDSIFGGLAFGYLTMLLALTTVFIGVKSYRDRELGGVIKFGRAFWVGLSIASIAAVAYLIGWELFHLATNYTFGQEYADSLVAAKIADGLEGPALEDYRAETQKFAEMYLNPFFRLPITLLEIAPIGLLVTLISGAILRKPEVLPMR